MRRNKLNRLILGMLACGILLTLLVNSAVGSARQRREAELAARTGTPEPGESAAGVIESPGTEQYGPGFLPTEAASSGTLPEADPAEEGQGTVGPGNSYNVQTPGTYEDFLRKFSETEQTIERMRASGRKNQSEVERQNAASSQLRYWETQMNSVYQTIMSVLSPEEAAMLSRDQQDWKKQREQNAAEAARNSAGSRQESTEYTLSQAEATRERAYELLERYRDRL